MTFDGSSTWSSTLARCLLAPSFFKNKPLNMASITEKQHIEISPGICGGKPRIAGSRIRVQDVYLWHELQGKSADAIVVEHPQLTVADVYAALTYFWDHRDEIERQMRDEVS